MVILECHPWIWLCAKCAEDTTTRKMDPRPQEALQVKEDKQRQTDSTEQWGSARAEARAGDRGDNRRAGEQRLTSCGPSGFQE